jgi:hypothetical protein
MGAEARATKQGISVSDCKSRYNDSDITADVLKVAAEPYETIAFRIPSRELEEEDDVDDGWSWTYWDPDTKQFSFQFMFKQQ